MTGILTVPEAAAELRVSQRFVLDELRRKNLRGSKTGAGWRIDPADIKTYLDSKANVSRVRRAS